MIIKSVSSVFKNRREKLSRAHPGAVFLIPGAPELIRNNDVHHAFRQDSSFYYLTGLEEADTFMVLGPGARLVLFVHPKDALRELWEGELHGLEGAQAVFGADEAYPISELEQKLPSLLKGADEVYYRVGNDEKLDRKVLGAMESLKKSLGRSGLGLQPLKDPGAPIGEMRLFKSPEEVELLRRAGKITGEAHREVMRQVRPGMNEFEVEALIDYLFRKRGCKRLGYVSIVAGGKNAACLHYRQNNEPLKDGDLVLIDAGGEYEYYTADITRTFPVGKKFTAAQAKVYDLVLRSQKEALTLCKPGATLPAIHQRACEVLVDGMLSMGFIKGSRAEVIQKAEHKRFYPHNTSHWLGMDVHDCGLYRIGEEPRKLEAGMCFTVEPGFYVQPNDESVPSEFRRLGIRIEDDIIITANGYENLTVSAPKEIAEIEALKV